MSAGTQEERTPSFGELDRGARLLLVLSLLLTLLVLAGASLV